MNVHFVLKSQNRKTGPIPTTMTSEDSCPDRCELKGAGCYAETGYTGMNWVKVSSGDRGGSWQDLCKKVSELPVGQLWRHNVAGDLPHYKQEIDGELMGDLIVANKGRNGFTYTHHDMDIGYNADIVETCNLLGFTINLSADNLGQVDALMDLDIGPVVTVVPECVRENFVTEGGHQVVICPAVVRDNVTCAMCKMCAIADRDFVVGFPAHGSGKGKIKF